jgi:hypothetical protein
MSSDADEDRFRTDLTADMRVMKVGMADMKNTMQQVADALLTLARHEERLANILSAMKRFDVGIHSLDVRTAALEQLAPVNRQTNDWVGKVQWAVIGGVLMFALNKVFV